MLRPARRSIQPSDERDEDLPAEVHELVVAEAGQRGAQPHEHEQEDQQLGEEPHRPPDPRRARRRSGPAGPPRNSVTMMADIVTVFMNSARKKSAKRIELYSVWKPPTSSCSASTRSNGGPVELGGAGDQEDHERHDAGDDHVPAREDPEEPVAGLAHHDVVGGQRPGQQHDRHHRQAERGFVGHHLRRRPHRAEQRVLRAGRPARQHHAVHGDRAAGEDEQHADRRVGELEPGVVAEDLDGALLLLGELAADRDHREHEEGRDEGEERGEDEHAPCRPGRAAGPP